MPQTVALHLGCPRAVPFYEFRNILLIFKRFFVYLSRHEFGTRFPASKTENLIMVFSW